MKKSNRVQIIIITTTHDFQFILRITREIVFRGFPTPSPRESNARETSPFALIGRYRRVLGPHSVTERETRRVLSRSAAEWDYDARVVRGLIRDSGSTRSYDSNGFRNAKKEI